jgi:site-specific DNA recombinase
VLGDIDLSGDMGRMLARILAAVAQGEVERKGARQKLANQQSRAAGNRWKSGWRPFGYELDGTIIPEEAALIEDAAEAVLTGTPLREIARRWKEAGVSTPRSDRGADGWTHHGVRAILLNPRNAAFQTYKGEITGAGNWEPIISEDTHLRLVAMLTDPSRSTRDTSGRPVANLLSGIAVCATCGEKVTAGTVGKTRVVDGKRQSIGREAVYKCPNNHLSVNREDADKIVIHAFAMAVMFDVRTTQLMPINRKGADGRALAEEADRLKEEMKALALSYADGRLSLDQLEIATSSVREKLETVEAQILDGESGDATVREMVNANVSRWKDLDTDTRRAMLKRLARIRLFPKGRGKKNVPIKYQVEMDLVTHWKDGTERLLPALRERPKDMPAVNTTPQARQRARSATPEEDAK